MLALQYLDERMDNQGYLEARVSVWLHLHNRASIKANWSFFTHEARIN